MADDGFDNLKRLVHKETVVVFWELYAKVPL